VGRKTKGEKMKRTPRPTDENIEAMLEEASKRWQEASDSGDYAAATYANGVLTMAEVVLGYLHTDALFSEE
tara:strand:- start:628 stop:840 length:213 start_codon:yes stop_codon:yes gene_type:complete